MCLVGKGVHIIQYTNIYREREREKKKNANVKLGTGHATVKPAFDDLGLGFEGVLLRRLDDVYGINITPFFKAIRDQDTRNIQVTFFLVKIIISQINTGNLGSHFVLGLKNLSTQKTVHLLTLAGVYIDATHYTVPVSHCCPQWARSKM